MIIEAVERCCQEMIARGEYTSHSNFVLLKHEGPNATEMMANDIVKLYLYASEQIDEFSNLNPPVASHKMSIKIELMYQLKNKPMNLVISIR